MSTLKPKEVKPTVNMLICLQKTELLTIHRAGGRPSTCDMSTRKDAIIADIVRNWDVIVDAVAHRYTVPQHSESEPSEDETGNISPMSDPDATYYNFWELSDAYLSDASDFEEDELCKQFDAQKTSSIILKVNVFDPKGGKEALLLVPQRRLRQLCRAQNPDGGEDRHLQGC